jgi:GTPase SAR1 family protein
MKFLCKECWLAHEPSTLLAACKECDARTQIHRLDPLRAKAASLTDDGGDLVCRLHRTEPLDVFCGECRRPIPPRAILGAQSIVALVGDTASGKTSLLWVLTERLRQSSVPVVRIRRAIGDSDEQLGRAMRDIVTHGGPRPTPMTDADVRNYAWELMLRESSRDNGWLMAFHDTAGEMWRELATLGREEYEKFYRYLKLVGSIILAIDGDRVREGLDTRAAGTVASPAMLAAEAHEITIVDELSRRVRARGQAVPVAVTVTKTDMLWDRPEWSMLKRDSGATADEIDNAVRELLRQSGREALLAALANSFAPIQFFAVSAFGRAPEAPLVLADLQPSRVEEPLLAVMGADRVHA